LREVRTAIGDNPVAPSDLASGAAPPADPKAVPNGDREGRPAVFRNRSFLLLWLGQLVSQLGDRVHALALIWWVLEKTGSAALMGTVLIVATVPSVILGPFAGGYVDRWNRKAVIVGMDFARGLIVVWIAVLAIRGALEIWQLLIGTAAMAIASVFFGPAVSATVPNLVRPSEITRANSLSQMVAQGTGIAGPALGGILVAVWGVGGVFLVNGLSFIASGVSELFIAIPPLERGPVRRKHIVAELADGFSFVRNQPTVFGILKTAAVLNFFTAPFAILLPIVARDYLGRGAEAFGFIMAAFSVGFLAASAVLAAVKDVRRKHPLIILGVSLAGGCLIAMGASVTYTSYVALMASIGVLLGLANILIMSYFQAVVPDALRGRVFGFMMTLSGGLQPLAFGVLGILTDLLTPPVIFVASGCALVVGGLYLYRVPGMRKV
jgi:DHA3 family macrolide efflux protein-like MFS transporter